MKKTMGSAPLDEGIPDARPRANTRGLGAPRSRSANTSMIADTRQGAPKSSDFAALGDRHWPKADTPFPNNG